MLVPQWPPPMCHWAPPEIATSSAGPFLRRQSTTCTTCCPLPFSSPLNGPSAYWNVLAAGSPASPPVRTAASLPQPSPRSATASPQSPTRAQTYLKPRSEEHTSELQSRFDLVCRLLLEKKNMIDYNKAILLNN